MLKSIFQAARENDFSVLNSILDNHPTLANCADEATGWSPLHFAAQHNSLQAAEILLQRGADCDARDPQGVSPLQLSGSEAMLRLLCKCGARFSENYQLLRKARQSKHLVRLTYHEHTRTIRIIQLGLSGAEERCFVWQNDAPGADVEPGPRCFRVHEMTDLEIIEPEAGEIPGDPSRMRACVAIVDED